MLRCDNVPHNIRSLSWFFPLLHGCEETESLLSQNALPGQYLLRKSPDHNHYTLSVRSQNGVKHFPVGVDGEVISFGMATFERFQDFLEHFNHKPIVSESSGQLIVLRSPFIAPKHTTVLETPNVHGLLLSKTTERFDKTGYLTKQGGSVKTWKERWFILDGNSLSYYKKANDTVPIKCIDLWECTGVRCFHLPQVIPGKESAFELKTPWRDYLMVSSCDKDRDSWAEMLREKIAWIKSQKEV